jgi:hypothetical protein
MARINPRPKSDQMITSHKITFIALCAALAPALTTEASAQLGYGREPVIVAQADGGQFNPAEHIELEAANGHREHQAITYQYSSEHPYYSGYQQSRLMGLKSRDRGISWTKKFIESEYSAYGQAWVSHYGSYLVNGSYAVGYSRVGYSNTRRAIYLYHEESARGDMVLGKRGLRHLDFEDESALFATTRGGGGGGFRLNLIERPGDTVITRYVAEGFSSVRRVRCRLRGSSIYCAFDGSQSGPAQTDVFFLSHDANSTSPPTPKQIDGDAFGIGVIREDSLEFLESDGNLLVYFREMDRIQSGVTVGFALASHDGGKTWSESLVTDPASGNAITFDIAMDGDRAVATWLELPHGGGDAKLMYSVSSDGGLSFTAPAETPRDPLIGEQNRVVPHVYLEGGRAVIAFFSLAFSTQNKWQAAYIYSNDGGVEFSDPVLLRNESWPKNSTLDWMYGDGSLNAVVQEYDSSTGVDNLWVTGVRFPFIQATQPQAGVIKLEMAGVDVTRSATPIARWVASTQRGISRHPDHSERWLDLAQSSLLRHSLHNSSRYSRAVEPDGTATRLTQIPLSFTGTVYIQGWVNNGGLNGGSSTSDVFELSL